MSKTSRVTKPAKLGSALFEVHIFRKAEWSSTGKSEIGKMIDVHVLSHRMLNIQTTVDESRNAPRIRRTKSRALIGVAMA